MDDGVKQLVRQRAGNCCEYCRVHQRYYLDSTFHVEHIVAQQHRGSDNPDNLALACHLCNNKKGPNLSGIDPETNELARLFHPRTDIWSKHFHLEESGRIVGLSPVGRTTVYVLDTNSAIRIEIRREIIRLEAKKL